MAKRKSPVARSKRPAGRSKRKVRRWSRRVTETSDAMTLEEGVFKKPSPRAIARSVMHSAERSHRRKSAPYRSAMSMLTFYVNRAGKGLSPSEKSKLDKAKDELRTLYGKAKEPDKKKKSKTKAKTARKRSKVRRKSS